MEREKETIDVDDMEYEIEYAYGYPKDIMPERLHPAIPENLDGAQVWFAFCQVVPKSAVVAVGATRPEMDTNIRIGIREFWVEATKKITGD